MKKKPTIKQLIEMTQLSRATIDRVLNQRGSVHPRSVQVVQQALRLLDADVASPAGSAPPPLSPGRTLHFKLLAQAGDAFTQSLVDKAAALAPALAQADVTLEVISCVGAGDDEVAETVRQCRSQADGLAVICTNAPVIVTELRQCMAQGQAVVTMVTDVDADARHGFVGMNNRAAGQAAGFLIGRHLQKLPTAKVAVVVATFAYTCHEDREIGFRSLIRHHFPHIDVLEVINGGDAGADMQAAMNRFLERHPDLDGIYNVSGGVDGLAAALVAHGLAGSTVSVIHEINPVTEPLLRAGAVDYALAQDLDALLNTTAQRLKSACLQQPAPTFSYLPIQTYSRYSL